MSKHHHELPTPLMGQEHQNPAFHLTALCTPAIHRTTATADPSINIINYLYDNILLDFCVLMGDYLAQPVRPIRPYPLADGRTLRGEHHAHSRTPHRCRHPDRPCQRPQELVPTAPVLVDCSPSRAPRRAPGRAQRPLGRHTRSRHPLPGRRRACDGRGTRRPFGGDTPLQPGPVTRSGGPRPRQQDPILHQRRRRGTAAHRRTHHHPLIHPHHCHRVVNAPIGCDSSSL
jgi:hypothetical protein